VLLGAEAAGPRPEVTAIRRTSTTSTDLAPTPRAILVALA